MNKTAFGTIVAQPLTAVMVLPQARSFFYEDCISSEFSFRGIPAHHRSILMQKKTSTRSEFHEGEIRNEEKVGMDLKEGGKREPGIFALLAQNWPGFSLSGFCTVRTENKANLCMFFDKYENV